MDNINISGTIEEIIYSNSENGYTVCAVVSDDGKLITATGYIPYITEGEKVVMSGYTAMHPDYGEQFKITSCQSILPTDEDSVLQYLSSGIVSGIRAATAKKLVGKFGTKIFDIMLNSPERLAEVKGISSDRAKKIGKSYSKLQSMREIVMFLQQYSVTSNTAVKVYNTLGGKAVKLVKENPYILADRIEGISFKTSDTIAYNMGIPRDSSQRLKAGIKYILNTAAYSDGSTYLPKSLLTEHAAYTLAVSDDAVEHVLDELTFDKDIYSDTLNDTPLCCLHSFYEAEYYIARRLCSLSRAEQKHTMSAEQAERAIAEYEKAHSVSLAAGQKDAIVTALSCGCMVLTGGPGTGKTTVIKAILSLMKSLKLSVALTAPTGRAAKRMSQVTGYEAKTIHRLLGTKQSEGGRFIGFSHDENHPLSAEVIIADEVSMIDVNLMASFLHAVKRGARVIFAGDADQLPSVGPGNVLRDIIDSGVIPVIKLNRIFRQGEESLIVMNAHRINRGELPDIKTHSSDFFFLKRRNAEDTAFTIIDLYMNRLPSSYGISPVTSIQVLSPMKKGVSGTENLNRLLQLHANPPSPDKQEFTHGKRIFREGDKVMQTRNNYDIQYISQNGEEGMGIYNGDMGIIKKIDTEDKSMKIVFDEDKEIVYPMSFADDLDLSYAITVHKSQGSEFPIVIIPVCTLNTALTSRNLFYTAVTRAKQMVILVGSERVIAGMTANNSQKKRFTGLCDRLLMMNEIFNSKHKNEFSF